MAEFMTPEEVAQRERAVAEFVSKVATAESMGYASIAIVLPDAIEIRDELERLAAIEKSYNDSLMDSLDG